MWHMWKVWPRVWATSVTTGDKCDCRWNSWPYVTRHSTNTDYPSNLAAGPLDEYHLVNYNMTDYNSPNKSRNKVRVVSRLVNCELQWFLFGMGIFTIYGSFLVTNVLFAILLLPTALTAYSFRCLLLPLSMASAAYHSHCLLLPLPIAPSAYCSLRLSLTAYWSRCL